MQKRILSFGNLSVELDPHEYYPDDPGAGCPVLVVHDSRSGGMKTASYTCAMNEEMLSGRDGDYRLSESQMRWLASLEDRIERFYKDVDRWRRAMTTDEPLAVPPVNDGR